VEKNQIVTLGLRGWKKYKSSRKKALRSGTIGTSGRPDSKVEYDKKSQGKWESLSIASSSPRPTIGIEGVGQADLAGRIEMRRQRPKELQ